MSTLPPTVQIMTSSEPVWSNPISGVSLTSWSSLMWKFTFFIWSPVYLIFSISPVTPTQIFSHLRVALTWLPVNSICVGDQLTPAHSEYFIRHPPAHLMLRKWQYNSLLFDHFEVQKAFMVTEFGSRCLHFWEMNRFSHQPMKSKQLCTFQLTFIRHSLANFFKCSKKAHEQQFLLDQMF